MWVQVKQWLASSAPRPRRLVPASEPPIATDRCRARIGALGFGYRLTVTAYPDRLTVRWPISNERTIHGSEISTLADEEILRYKVTIEHSAPGLASPVVLTSPSDSLCQALWKIRRDDPLPAALPPRKTLKGLEVIGLVLLLLVCLVAAGSAVSDLFHEEYGFSTWWKVAMGLGTYGCARELIKHARSS